MATSRIWGYAFELPPESDTSFRSRLITPPLLRTTADGDDEEDRRATWLELFFDLVFVVAVAELVFRLRQDESVAGFLEFAALAIPLWWVWVGFTIYADRFDSDDLVFRVVMLASMLAVAALAVQVPHATAGGGAFHGGSAGFAAAYVVTRSLLVGLYERARRHVPEAHDLCLLYMSGFGAGALVWAASIAVPTPARFVVWGVAMTIEIATPLAGYRIVQRTPVHASHVVERFGLFTLIVLGETIVSVASGTAGIHWAAAGVIGAGVAFVVAAALWWIYFDFVDVSVVRQGLLSGQVYVYGHLPIFVALCLVGGGTQSLIRDAAHDHLRAGTRWELCGGVALYLLAISAIHRVTTHHPRDAVIFFRMLFVLLFCALAAFPLPPLAVIGGLAAGSVAMVVIEMFQGHRREEWRTYLRGLGEDKAPARPAQPAPIASFGDFTAPVGSASAVSK